MRRNGLAVSMSAGVLLALLLGSAAVAWQAVRAQHEAQRATAIKDFLVGVFESADYRTPSESPRGSITAAQMLDQSYGRIERSFTQQPEIQIELLDTTADIYRVLHETKRSSDLYQRETELARAYYGPTDIHTIDGLMGQADAAVQNDDFAGATSLLAEADQLIHAAGLDTSDARAIWLVKQGELQRIESRPYDAEQSLLAALGLFKKSIPNDSNYGDALVDLGGAYMAEHQFSKSADYLRQEIALAQKPNSNAGVDLILAYSFLGRDLRAMGDVEGASQAYAAGVNAAGRLVGTQDRRYWDVAEYWAAFRWDQGDRTALDFFRQLTNSFPKEGAAFRSTLEVQVAARAYELYATTLIADGQGQAAIECLQRAQTLMGLSAAQAAARSDLQLLFASAYELIARPREAEQGYLAALQQTGVASEAKIRVRYGAFLLSQKEVTAAGAQFDDALRLTKDSVDVDAVDAEAGLAQVAIARSDAAGALDFSARALQHLSQITPGYDVRTYAYVWKVRALSLLLDGDARDALGYAQRAKDADERNFSLGSWQAAESTALLHDVDIAGGHRSGPERKLSEANPIARGQAHGHWPID